MRIKRASNDILDTSKWDFVRLRRATDPSIPEERRLKIYGDYIQDTSKLESNSSALAPRIVGGIGLGGGLGYLIGHGYQKPIPAAATAIGAGLGAAIGVLDKYIKDTQIEEAKRLVASGDYDRELKNAFYDYVERVSTV